MLMRSLLLKNPKKRRKRKVKKLVIKEQVMRGLVISQRYKENVLDLTLHRTR